RKIDGLDIWPLLSGAKGAKSPHEAFYFYYNDNELQAVSSAKWKLYLPHTYRTLDGEPGGHDGLPVRYVQRKLTQAELYDLDTDIGEQHDVASRYPDVVARLSALAEGAREELGDALRGRKGKGTRAPGRLATDR